MTRTNKLRGEARLGENEKNCDGTSRIYMKRERDAENIFGRGKREKERERDTD